MILAGGANTRFGGQPKGLEVLAGRRILDRVVDALRPAADRLLLLSNDPGASLWAPAGLAVRADVRRSPTGQPASLVGVYSALVHAAGPALVVAWDMPFVPAALLRAMRRLGSARGRSVVPFTSLEGRTGIPLATCAYYDASALDIAGQQLDAGNLRLSAFVAAIPNLERLEGAELAALGDPKHMFLNVNDTESLAVAERLAASTPP